MFARRAVALIVMVCLLPACAYTRLQTPTLTVVEVQFLKGDVFSQDLRVRMRV